MTSPMAYFAATDSAERPGTYSGMAASAARMRIMRPLSRVAPPGRAGSCRRAQTPTSRSIIAASPTATHPDASSTSG